MAWCSKVSGHAVVHWTWVIGHNFLEAVVEWVSIDVTWVNKFLNLTSSQCIDVSILVCVYSIAWKNVTTMGRICRVPGCKSNFPKSREKPHTTRAKWHQECRQRENKHFRIAKRPGRACKEASCNPKTEQCAGRRNEETLHLREALAQQFWSS